MYPEHLKIVWRGVFLETPEEWSFSAKFSGDVTLWADAELSNINKTGMLTAYSACFNTADWQSSVELREWRAYKIGETGKMLGNPRIEVLPVADRQKGTSVARFPTDTSLCVTTEAANRGPARLGRFYLPGPAKPLGSDHRLSVANATAYVNTITTFLKGVSDQIDFDDVVFQGSDMLNISGVGAGTRQDVRNIRVGRVYDRIERRRRSMEEDYQVSGTIDW